MALRLLLRIAVLLVLLAACGGKSPKGDVVAQLLPEDAQIVVRFRTVERGDALLKSMASPYTPTLSALLSAYPGAGPDSFRRDLPLAIAISVSRDRGDAAIAAALPARAPDDLAGRFNEGSGRALGDYVGVSSRGEYPKGGCALWTKVRDADMSARVDLAALGGSDNPAVDTSVTQAAAMARFMLDLVGVARAGVDPEQVSEALAAWLRGVLDSGESIDFVMDLEDGGIRMELAYTARPGTPFAERAAEPGGLSALAAHAPDGSPYTLLFRLDPGWIARIAGIPGLEPALKGLSGDWLISGAVHGSGGMRAVVATRATDAAVSANALAALLAGAPIRDYGFVCAEKKIEAKDMVVRRFRIKADPEALAGRIGEEQAARAGKILGPEGLPVEIVARGGTLLVAWGEEGLGPRLLVSSKPPDSLARKLAGLPGNLRFLAAIDVGAFAGGLRQLAGDDESLPDLKGRIDLYGASSDRTWTWGGRVDRSYLDAIR